MFKIDINTEMQSETTKQEVLIRIISMICKFSSAKGEREERITFLNKAIGIMEGLISTKKHYIQSVAIPLYSKLLEEGEKQVKAGDYLLMNAGIALQAAIIILQSNNEEWKKALITQLKANKKALEVKRDALLKPAQDTRTSGFFVPRQSTSQVLQKRPLEHTAIPKVNESQDQVGFKAPQPVKKLKDTAHEVPSQKEDQGNAFDY